MEEEPMEEVWWMGMRLDELKSSGDYRCDPKEKKRKEEIDFNDDDLCGLVFGNDQVVKVGLTNIKDGNMRILSVEPPKDFKLDVWKDFSWKRRFAFVEGKLFMIGGSGVNLLDEYRGDSIFVNERNTMYPLGVHFCDLQKVCSSSSESGQFELAAHLKGPKITPIVVPYKKKKEIFLISNPWYRYILHPFPFEVLSFSNEGFAVKQLRDPPFWVQGKFVRVEAHAVAKNILYVCVLSKDNRYTLYGFDMEKSEWLDFKMVLPGAYDLMMGNRADLDMKLVPPHILASFLKEERSFICIHNDKSFQLEGLYVSYGYVIPVDENQVDLFLLIICLRKNKIDKPRDYDDYIRVCKFKLGEDGEIKILTPISSDSSWGCEFGPFPELSQYLLHAFTCDYSTELKTYAYVSYRSKKWNGDKYR
ncbi:hypothetical protein LINPERHAP2_LOCUS18929 [Linum perenne]